MYRCKPNCGYGPGTCTGGASITAPNAEQHVTDWLFEFFSSDRLDAHNAKTLEANLAQLARIDRELAFAVGELNALRSRAASPVGGGELHQIVTVMIARVQGSTETLNGERVTLIAEHPQPLTHEQLVMVWPALSNESRRTLLRQLIDHIDLAPGRGSLAERLNIILRADHD